MQKVIYLVSVKKLASNIMRMNELRGTDMRYPIRDILYEISFVRYSIRDILYEISFVRYSIRDILCEISFVRYSIRDILYEISFVRYSIFISKASMV